MKNEIIDEVPVYQKIAIDIAKKIINGKYSLGEKLSGRSTLASESGFLLKLFVNLYIF